MSPSPTPLTPGRVRPTRRVALHLLLGLLLYGAGANVGAGWVVLLAAMLLATIPAGWWAVRARVRNVAVRRTTPRTTSTGQTTRTTLSVHAPGRGLVVAHDALGDVVGVTTTDGERLVTADPRLDRGVHDVATVEVLLGDAFGMFRASATGPVALDPPLLVRPVPADEADLEELRGTSLEGDDDQRRRRRGADVDGIREHRPDDPVRAIHWRASARRGELLVRELRGPQDPPLHVVLAPHAWPRDVLDRTCELVLGLLATAHAEGRSVHLHADGEVATGVADAADLLATLPPHATEAVRPLLPSRAAPDGAVVLAPGDDGPRALEEAGA